MGTAYDFGLGSWVSVKTKEIIVWIISIFLMFVKDVIVIVGALREVPYVYFHHIVTKLNKTDYRLCFVPLITNFITNYFIFAFCSCFCLFPRFETRDLLERFFHKHERVS